jgi:hypothetical protein
VIKNSEPPVIHCPASRQVDPITGVNYCERPSRFLLLTNSKRLLGVQCLHLLHPPRTLRAIGQEPGLHRSSEERPSSPVSSSRIRWVWYCLPSSVCALSRDRRWNSRHRRLNSDSFIVAPLTEDCCFYIINIFFCQFYFIHQKTIHKGVLFNFFQRNPGFNMIE